MKRSWVAGLWLVLACSSGEELRVEPSAPAHVAQGAASADDPPRELEPTPAQPAPAKPLPTLGDPLGLLSKPTAERDRKAAARELAESLDPGALRSDEPTVVTLERDPRAVRRGQERSERSAASARPGRAAGLRETSASSLLMRVRQTATPHVLYLHASYCKACRNVLPRLLETAEKYEKRGVRFSAASVDRDESLFAAYAPALRGVLEPLWITPDGTLGDALRASGLAIEGNSFAIPLVAVFRARRVVMQGHSREVRELPATLDGML
jgi:thiol-disulfide isomerase/thioredoxin